MKSIQIRLPDSKYYDLVALSAEERKDVDEFAREHLLALVDDNEENSELYSFQERVIEEFDLEPGTKTAENVLGVATRMQEGMTWKEAYKDRAQEYADKNDDVESAEKYQDTVRDCCTRRVGMKTAEFRQRVSKLIDKHDRNDHTTDRSGEITSGKDNRYLVQLSSSEEVIATFGDDPAMDQSDVMKKAVDYLIEEHELISRISIPYIIETKALINDTPTYPDGNEKMRHYKRLSGDYYLDTHYKKADKRNRLAELAGKCGLGVTFGERWY